MAQELTLADFKVGDRVGVKSMLRDAAHTGIVVNVDENYVYMDSDDGVHYKNAGWWAKSLVKLPPLLASETINHPSHYGGDTTYEAIKVIEAWGLGFCLGTVAKYICRHGKKPGATALEDLKKAAWFLQREIEALEKV